MQPKTRRIRKGSNYKYVSPFRQPKVVPTEVTCVECSLPSAKGLPPFTSRKEFDGEEFKSVYRHAVCPSDPENLLKLVDRQCEVRREDWERIRKVGGEVVSYSKRDGALVRTVVA